MSRIRILLVEDCVDDAELLAIELRESGLEVELTRIDDERRMRAYLIDVLPDLIISDSSLPGFSGRQALQMARELAPDAPFVFFSGGFDQAAEESGLARAADICVFKHDLARMPDVVRSLLP